MRLGLTARLASPLTLLAIAACFAIACDKPVDDGTPIPKGTIGIDVNARKHPQASCTNCTSPGADPGGADPAGGCECTSNAECGECLKCSSTSCGVCVADTTQNGNSCTNTNPCQDFTCSAGLCVGVNDNTNTCGTCKLCSSGQCLNVGAGLQGNGCTDANDLTPYNCIRVACTGGGACSQNYNNHTDGRDCGVSGTSPDGPTECASKKTCHSDGLCRADPTNTGLPCSDSTPTDCYANTCQGGSCTSAAKTGGQACNPDGVSPVVAATACSNADTCGAGTGVCNPNHVANDTQPAGCNAACNACSNGACTARSGAAPLFGCTDSSPTDCYNAACLSGTCTQQPAQSMYIKATDTPCNPTGTNGAAAPCYSCQSTSTSSTCTARTTAGTSSALSCNDDGQACTDDYCSSGSCVHPADDTNTCGVCKTCSGGSCNNIVGPVQASGCNGICQECVNGTCGPTPAGILRAGCTADAVECTDDWCVGGMTGASACVHPNKSGGQPCGSSANTECTNPDTCGPNTGICNSNHENNGTACTDTKPNDCYVAACSGGSCSQTYDAAGKNGAACTQSVNGTDPVVPAQPPCSAADTCLAGVCQPNHVPNNTQVTGCDSDCNACNGSGACTARTGLAPLLGCTDANPTDCFFAACIAGACTQQPTDPAYRKTANTACNPDGVGAVVGVTTCSLADTCDAAGVCQPNHQATSVACGDNVCNNCDGAGACVASSAGVAGPGCMAAGGDCSAADTCDVSGACQANDFPDGTPCKTGVCEQCAGGGCIKTPTGQQGPNCQAVATECSDADTCDNGVCKPNHKIAGTPCSDATPGDCNIAECDGSGACVQAHRVLNDGLGCGDGVCNQCSGGACVPTGNGLSGPGCNAAGTECSNAGSCDGSGNCMGNPKEAGLVCTDLTPTDCKIAKCNGAGACDQNYADRTDGIACGDGVCNECQTGVCIDTAQGVVGPGCSADANACTHDYCSGVGTCVHPPKTGSSCDDGDACTYDDKCTNMSSCAGTAISCVSDVCGTRTCNGTSTCTLVAHDDVECDADGDKCTPKDKCKNGLCVKDDEVVCVQQDCFTEATCNKDTGECESLPLSNVPCGLTGCFESGTCTSGVCSGTPVSCAFLDEGCLRGVCDTNAPGDGQEKCVQIKRPNGTSCENKCLIDAVCVSGECQGDIKPCSTTATCRAARCEPTTGECVEELATPGTPCALTNDCLENTSCNASGECRGTLVPDGSPCSSAADCTGAATCSSGACICSGEPADLSVAADLGGGGTLMPDLTGVGGGDAPKCGCQAGPDAIPQSVLFFLIVGFGLRRRRS